MPGTYIDDTASNPMHKGYYLGCYIPIMDGVPATINLVAIDDTLLTPSTPILPDSAGILDLRYGIYPCLNVSDLLTNDMATKPAPIVAIPQSSNATDVRWHLPCIKMAVTQSAPNQPAILTMSYDGSPLPAMPNGVIPAGYRYKINKCYMPPGSSNHLLSNVGVFVRPQHQPVLPTTSDPAPVGSLDLGDMGAPGAEDAPMYTGPGLGFSSLQGTPPRNVFFVPFFRIRVSSSGVSLAPNGDGSYTLTLRFDKPLNANQKVDLTNSSWINSNGVTGHFTPVIDYNSSGQAIGAHTPISAAWAAAPTAGIHLRATYSDATLRDRAWPWASGTAFTEDMFSDQMHDVVAVGVAISGTDTIPPVISSALIVSAQVQRVLTPAWILAGNITVQFSVADSGFSTGLKQWELIYVPLPNASAPGILQSVAPYVPNSRIPPQTVVGAGTLAGVSATCNVVFNPNNLWAKGSWGYGSLLLKVYDNAGNVSSLTVGMSSAIAAGLPSAGIFTALGGAVVLQSRQSVTFVGETAPELSTAIIDIIGGPAQIYCGKPYLPTRQAEGAFFSLIQDVTVTCNGQSTSPSWGGGAPGSGGFYWLMNFNVLNEAWSALIMPGSPHVASYDFVFTITDCLGAVNTTTLTLPRR